LPHADGTESEAARHLLGGNRWLSTNDEGHVKAGNRSRQGGVMRRLGRSLAVLVAVMAIAAASVGVDGQERQKVTLTYAGFGGALLEAEKKAFLEPYMKANPHVTIITDTPVDYAKLKAMVEAKNVTWDVVEVGSDFGLKRQEALLEPIDCAVVPCQDLQPEKYKTTGYRAVFGTFSPVLGYRTDVFPAGKEPKGWPDFYDLKGFPGKRVLFRARPQYILESALIGDGVDPKQLYPLDVDRAFRKLDTVKDAIVWANSTQHCAELLRAKTAVMGLCFNGRLADVQAQGAPVAMQWNAGFVAGGYVVIPKGSKNAKEAMKLIAYMTSAEHNADFSWHYPSAPVNRRALAKADPAKKEVLGTEYADRIVGQDDVWWTDNFEAVNLRFQEWLRK
jgi:putative spermidine/putrescine transport system substrate-binding protein